MQARLLAQEVNEHIIEHGCVPGAPPLPDDGSSRIAWLLAEMNAARGALAGADESVLDIADAHGDGDHRETLVRVRETTQLLVASMASVVLAST